MVFEGDDVDVKPRRQLLISDDESSDEEEEDKDGRLGMEEEEEKEEDDGEDSEDDGERSQPYFKKHRGLPKQVFGSLSMTGAKRVSFSASLDVADASRSTELYSVYH